MFVLILSSMYDESTDMAVDWLEKFKITVRRINVEDLIKSMVFNLNNDSSGFLKIELQSSTIEISANGDYTFWYRKGRFKHLWETEYDKFVGICFTY